VLSQERSNIRAFWLLLSYCYIVWSCSELWRASVCVNDRSPFGLDMLEEREDLKVQRTALSVLRNDIY
jgi:hypothetical protein